MNNFEKLSRSPVTLWHMQYAWPTKEMKTSTDQFLPRNAKIYIYAQAVCFANKRNENKLRSMFAKNCHTLRIPKLQQHMHHCKNKDYSAFGGAHVRAELSDAASILLFSIIIILMLIHPCAAFKYG